MQKARYEIVLPLNKNDGTTQPIELIHRTMDELVNTFGGVTRQAASEGIWKFENTTYRDSNNVLAVDVEDTEDTVSFMKILKEVLEQRFEQTAIYITRHPIEVL